MAVGSPGVGNYDFIPKNLQVHKVECETCGLKLRLPAGCTKSLSMFIARSNGWRMSKAGKWRCPKDLEKVQRTRKKKHEG